MRRLCGGILSLLMVVGSSVLGFRSLLSKSNLNNLLGGGEKTSSSSSSSSSSAAAAAAAVRVAAFSANRAAPKRSVESRFSSERSMGSTSSEQGACAAHPADFERPLIIFGPSGVGKGTLIAKILDKYPKLFSLSVSHTTRPPRPGEVHGVHYYFTTEADMEARIAGSEFLEHARVHKRIYGTSLEAVKNVATQKKVCILDIDTQGVASVKKIPKTVINPWYLFISPPSLEILERRLRGRSTEDEDQLQTRLLEAEACMQCGKKDSDAIIVNDVLEDAFSEVEKQLLKWYPSLSLRSGGQQ